MVFGKCVKCTEMKANLVKAGHRGGKRIWLCEECIRAKYPLAVFANDQLEGPSWVIEEVLKK